MGVSWTKETITNSGTTGTTASTNLVVDDVRINGATIGHADDTDLMVLSNGTLSLNGILAATGNITCGGTITGTLATAAQTNITSLGTLTTLTVDNIITNGTTIGHTSDTDLLSLADGALTLNGTLSSSGLITATSGVKLGNNKIYASDGGETITLDTSDNVTILGDLAVTGGDITSSSGAISFGNENLNTTGWLALGIATREASETLRVHGTDDLIPSILLTSIYNREGGQITIKGSAGDGVGDVDYSDYYVALDMYDKTARLLYDAKGGNMVAEAVFEVNPQGTNENEEKTHTIIRHVGDGKIVLKGSSTNNSAHDQVNIGEGGDKDQILIFHNSGTVRYMGIDADQSDKFRIGTGATMGSAISLEIDTSHNVSIPSGDLIITGATNGIKHTGSGTVTQGTSITTAVTLNTTSGVITMHATGIAADENIEFTVNNSTVQADSVILLTMQDENTTDNTQLVCATHTIAGGSFKITVANTDSAQASSATASKIHFLIINNS